jgi:hypothetical protein
MRGKNGTTPKEEALAIQIEALRRIVQRTEHLDAYINENELDSFRVEVVRHLRHMHNRLLIKSGFDGSPL